jgi:DNA polymerase III subunit alpha
MSIAKEDFVHLHVHSDYCVSPNARVLTTDLRWLPAGELKVGDELIGFDEDLRKNSGMKPTVIQAIKRVVRPCSLIKTSDGREIIASDLHGWVTVGTTRGSQISLSGPRNHPSPHTRQWLHTCELMKGNLSPFRTHRRQLGRSSAKLAQFCKPWGKLPPEYSETAAWFGGILDGEGWLSNRQIGVGQNPGPVFDAMVEACKILELPTTDRREQSKNSDVLEFNLSGYGTALKCLSWCRNFRFDSRKIWEGIHPKSRYHPPVELVSVEPIGEREVVAIQTDTQTLIVEGFLSHNSTLDGACTVEELVRKAKRCGHKALAVTDHGNVCAALNLYKEAGKTHKIGGREIGPIKPIIGTEAYLFDGDLSERGKHIKSNTYNHITLLAQNETGWRNLSKLSSLGYLKGFYYKPRVNWELLEEYSEGIIALSGCLKGALSVPIVQGDMKKAFNLCGRMHDIFGKRMFLEIQPTPIDSQYLVNDACIRFSTRMGIPLAATCDVHYIEAEDVVVQNIKICIANKMDMKTNRISHEGIYYRSTEEIEKIFRHVPEAITNTRRIADMIDFEFPTVANGEPYHLPKFDCPNELSEPDYFEKLARDGLVDRYGDQITNEHEDRLSFELDVIKNSGYASYFLVTADFIQWAKDHDIPVGPGRGSAAGSIIAYSMGITDIEPLKYGLLFERFLNPDRVSMPDIDIDFCEQGRTKVIDYVREKYGTEAVCQIATFGTLGTKSVIKDVARVMGFDYKLTNQMTKTIGKDDTVASWRRTPAAQGFVKKYPELTKILDYSEKLEGKKRNLGKHAAAVVIADTNLEERIPIAHVKKAVTTQFAMEEVEEVGLLKMDFLGLRTLTVIHNAEHLISKRLGRKFSIRSSEIDIEDKATYDMISSGHTKGVFQLESKGFRELLRKALPDCFEDIIALLALYRPGPLGADMDKHYVERKHGREEIKYHHPCLEPFLKDTQGGILYQEQIMQIANKCAGFTMAQADVLRKGVGKKKPEFIAKMKPKFIKGLNEHSNVEEKIANDIWADIEFFAQYGFNKSHSTAYGTITFYTAYLKTHYPVEYMAATLSSYCRDNDRMLVYIDECRRLGIDILPPDIHNSELYFNVVDGKIIYGFRALDGLGEQAANAILEARKRVGTFKSIFHFSESLGTAKVNKAIFETLIKTGAFRDLGHIAQLLEIADEALEGGKKQRKRDINQGDLFSFDEEEMIEELDSERLPDVPLWPNSKIQEIEKEVLGFYLSSHPLDDHRELMSNHQTHTTTELTGIKDGESFVVGGIIKSINVWPDRNNNDMARVVLEDHFSEVECLIFSSIYSVVKDSAQLGRKVFLKGRFQSGKDGRETYIVNEVNSFESEIKRLEKTSRREKRKEKEAEEFERELAFGSLSKFDDRSKKKSIDKPKINDRNTELSIDLNGVEKKPADCKLFTKMLKGLKDKPMGQNSKPVLSYDEQVYEDYMQNDEDYRIHMDEVVLGKDTSDQIRKENEKEKIAELNDKKDEQEISTGEQMELQKTEYKKARVTTERKEGNNSKYKKVTFGDLEKQLKSLRPNYVVNFELSTQRTTFDDIDQLKEMFERYPGHDIVRYRFIEIPLEVYELGYVEASNEFEDELHKILGKEAGIKIYDQRKK